MKARIPFEGWRPSHQTLEAIAVVLCSHWATARRPESQTTFWPRPARWLDQARLTDGRAFNTNWVTPR